MAPYVIVNSSVVCNKDPASMTRQGNKFLAADDLVHGAEKSIFKFRANIDAMPVFSRRG
jgi:hypothetical protein